MNNATDRSRLLTSAGRDNNFQFLRLLFALLVLLAHSPEIVDGDRHREVLTTLFNTVSFGEIAVGGFFLLSGFLIVQSWDRTPSLVPFIKKRFLRIVPAFVVASLLCAVVVGPLGSDTSVYWAQFDISRYVKTLFLLKEPAVPPVFQGTPHAAINASMWTISYEVRCYLLVAVAGVCGVLKRTNLWATMSALALALATLPLPQLPGNASGNARLVAFFCMGGCFYLYRRQLKMSHRRAQICFALLTLGLFSHKTAYLSFGLAGSYFLFWFAFTRIPSIEWFKTAPDFSYGLYLYGWPIQKLLQQFIPGISPWLLFVLASMLSSAVGLLSWYWVERPLLHQKPSRTNIVSPAETALVNVG